jgi:four helix bundle protein
MKNEMFQDNVILRLSFEFSLSIIAYCETLNAEKKFVVSNQILKSGTSIGANAMEAQNAESKADFIHKMKIAAKEGGETQYWLMLCKFSTAYPDCEPLLIQLEEINKILNSILKTSKKKNPFSYILSYLIF